MFDSGSYVARDLAHQQRMRRLLMQQKRGLPKGRLTTTKINGRLYYYRVVDGKKEYLGTGENEIVLKLQKKYFIEETVKRIDKNCKYMDKLIAGYASVDPEDIMEAAPRAYQSLPKSCFTMVGINNQRGWSYEPYKRYMGYPEQLNNKTLKGDFVRSKSEAIIANMQFVKKIEYHYEEELVLGEYTFAPDFKIAVKSQRKCKLLEHFGLIGDKDYRDTCMWKIRTYLEFGYRPYEDILFTYDDKDGHINTLDIDKVIESFCR